MPFEKGREKTGGRKKGSTSRNVELAREAIANLIDLNVDNMSEWLERVAKKNPKEAFDCMIKVMEYHIPKLNRIESDESKTDQDIHIHINKLVDEDNLT